MPSCGQNTLSVSSSKACSNKCGPTCALGPTDPLECGKVGPRPRRDLVIQQIKDYVLLMLGAPVVSLEIDDQQIDLAVKQTLKIMEYYAPREYFSYYQFNTTPGKSVYEMPPDVGYIRNVHYKKTPELAFTSADLQGSIPIEYFYPGGSYASIQGGLIDPIQPIWGSAGPWALQSGYTRMYTRMSSGLGGWEWVGDYRHIKLYPIPFRAHHVHVQYMQRCKDWDQVELAMQEGSLAIAKQMLGRVRSKFANIPGPGGGLQLDGQALLQEGNEEYKQWKQDLIYVYGEPTPPITMD